MSATVNTRARNLRPGLAQFEQFMRNYVKPPVAVPFQSLVTNGTFDTDSDWTKGTGWTIGGGEATHAAGTGSDLTQPTEMVPERRYVSGLSVSAVRATSTLFMGVDQNNQYISVEAAVTIGEKTQAFHGSGDGLFYIRASSPLDFDIDNVSLWEANPANDKPWLRLPYGMTVDEYGSVYRDGQRLMEGDFYLRTTGDPMQNFVEPITPPGASTRFIVDCSEVRR